jgi:hypothetical protein
VAMTVLAAYSGLLHPVGHRLMVGVAIPLWLSSLTRWAANLSVALEEGRACILLHCA